MAGYLRISRNSLSNVQQTVESKTIQNFPNLGTRNYAGNQTQIKNNVIWYSKEILMQQHTVSRFEREQL